MYCLHLRVDLTCVALQWEFNISDPITEILPFPEMPASEPHRGRGVFWACGWWANHLAIPNAWGDSPRPFTHAAERVCMLMSRRIRDAIETDKSRCFIYSLFESTRGIKVFYQSFSEVGHVFGYIPFDKTQHFWVVPAEIEEFILLYQPVSCD